MMNELRLSQDSLRALSDNTGGFAVLNQNGFASSFDRIVQDNSSYYVLAYYPPAADSKPGKFHKIEVNVARPGVTIRARQGYATPNAKPAAAPANAGKATSPEIQNALESPLPLTGLTLHVFAAPFKGTPANASVFVLTEMSGRDLKLAPKSTVELSYRAVDAEGKIRGGDTQLVTLPGQRPARGPGAHGAARPAHHRSHRPAAWPLSDARRGARHGRRQPGLGHLRSRCT